MRYIILRIAICDDNPVQLQIMEEKANGCAHWCGEALEIDVFSDGVALLEAVRSGNVYEYIFLDIEMPGISGLDIYSEISRLCENPIIFVSSHTNLLPEVFRLRACGFLSKPYDQDTFDRTIKSVIEQSVESQFFQFVSAGTFDTIPCKDILLFDIENYVLTMYRTNGEPVVISRKNLDDIERELSVFGFFRCNRSVLVNLRYCSNRKANNLSIRGNSKHGEEIAISRRRLKEYDKRLILYRMGGKDAF